MTTCPVCGSHLRDKETCPECGPIVKDSRSHKNNSSPKQQSKKGGGTKTIPRDGKK